MKKNRLRTPDGVRDYLPCELLQKTEIEQKIKNVFQKHCYEPVSSPMFEFVEVFEETGSISERQMYKFLDRDGSILTLRADMTPPIARIAATSFFKNSKNSKSKKEKEEKEILRLCYCENTFRYNENYQGKLKEFTQAGIELLGAESYEADGEVIAIAICSLIEAGLTDFKIDLGQVQFLDGILKESGIDSEICAKLRQKVMFKEFTAVEKIVENEKENIPKGIKTLLLKLPLLIGGKEVIDNAKTLVGNEISIAALDGLLNLYNVLCDYGFEKYIMFDLSMVGHLDYYTSLIFRGHAFGSGASIIDGGRYDALLSKFDSPSSAVGFAIRCDRLIDAVSARKKPLLVKKPETLIAYSEIGRAAAFAVASNFRKDGVLVETSLCGYSIKDNTDYAKSKEFGGMLYFTDKSHVKVFNFLDGSEKDVDIDDIINTNDTNNDGWFA